jgi:hypothetical protein
MAFGHAFFIATNLIGLGPLGWLINQFKIVFLPLKNGVL